MIFQMGKKDEVYYHLTKPLFDSAFAPAVRKNLNFFFLKTGGLVFLDYFDVLISKIIFKK